VRHDGLFEPLAACDVAVVAGGVTLYEACALGVPAVGLAVVEPQRKAIRSCAALGAVLDAGGPGLDAAAADRVARGVLRLLRDDPLRHAMASRGRRLVDGRGADRVARRIRALVASRRGGRHG
jgi:spore coat polysaccharide biosynthesis predicted glycosyltransferase SpsG